MDTLHAIEAWIEERRDWFFDLIRIYLGIGRDSSYEAVKRGEIPAIRIGKLLRVPIVAMERLLEQAGAAS